MGLLSGKTALIFGLANDRSIAWGISQAFHREGATLGFSYAGEILEKRVRPALEDQGTIHRIGRLASVGPRQILHGARGHTLAG